MTPEEIHKSNRANAYMQMTTQSEGWKYLKAELQELISKSEKIVLRKQWNMPDMGDTGKRQVAQVEARALRCVLEHVQNSIDKEMNKRSQANQGVGEK